MRIQQFITGLVLVLVSHVGAGESLSPFARLVDIDFGKVTDWVFKDKTATKSGSNSGIYYHLIYDKKQLRLHMSDGPEDTEASAKKYDQLVIEDVMIDGKRLPLFQWCLQNQQKHSRFLQQGLQVRKNMCVNEGSKGAFLMRLTLATVELVKAGKKLSFVMRPFRTSTIVNFDVSDFNTVVAELGSRSTKNPEKMAEKKCEVISPKGFTELTAVEYTCGDEGAKAKANAAIAAALNAARERWKEEIREITKKEQVAKEAEKEKPEKSKAIKNKVIEHGSREDKPIEDKSSEDALADENAALATSVAQQKFIANDISNKMIAVCKKKWDAGEHRCYCEKYIKHAPAEIQSDPSC
jgi:hypothetical protein